MGTCELSPDNSLSTVPRTGRYMTFLRKSQGQNDKTVNKTPHRKRGRT